LDRESVKVPVQNLGSKRTGKEKVASGFRLFTTHMTHGGTLDACPFLEIHLGGNFIMKASPNPKKGRGSRWNASTPDMIKERSLTSKLITQQEFHIILEL
jgi:hypothetical protein